jgi:hypothetical protein
LVLRWNLEGFHNRSNFKNTTSSCFGTHFYNKSNYKINLNNEQKSKKDSKKQSIEIENSIRKKNTFDIASERIENKKESNGRRGSKDLIIPFWIGELSGRIYLYRAF